MNGTSVLRDACATVANCSALVKPSAATSIFAPERSTRFRRACNSGVDAGIAATAGAASARSVRSARFTGARGARGAGAGTSTEGDALGSLTVETLDGDIDQPFVIEGPTRTP